MAKQRIDNFYIADGLAEDCEELILKCSQVSKLSFEKFSAIWREMEFSTIFHGRPSGSELAEFSEEALHIAKFFMVSNIHNNFEKSVAGLFLVYGILNLQPFPRLAPLRLVQEDVPAIQKLEYIARRERRHDILYILGEVLIRGPCQFHVSARERGLDFCIRKYYDGYTQHSMVGKRPTGVFHRHNEELDIIRELCYLEDRYEKAKKKINGPAPDRSLSYANNRLAKDLQTSLKSVVSGIVVQDANNRTDDTKDKQIDHYDSVQAIKQKAMRNVVDPMKHLTGVEDRNKKREASTTKTKTKKSIEYIKLLGEKPRSTSNSPESPIKSPKPYPWSLKLFNEFEQDETSTSNHKPYKNVLRTSPRVKKSSTTESPTKPDPGLMLIELEPVESSNENLNNDITPTNTQKTPIRRSPRKNATPKRVRIDRMISFDESPDEEPPAKKTALKRAKKTDNEFSSISNNESQFVELSIDQLPIEFSAQNNNLEIEIIDLYKGKKDKKTIKFEKGKKVEMKSNESLKVKSNVNQSEVMKNEPSTSKTAQKRSEVRSNEANPKRMDFKGNESSPKLLRNKHESEVIQNEPSTSKSAQKRSEVKSNEANPKRKDIKGNESSPKLSRNETEVKQNEPSTSKVTQKRSKILRKHMKLTKLKSRIKRLGVDQVADFESGNDSLDS